MSGNVPLRGFLLAMLTRLFNVVQTARRCELSVMPPATVADQRQLRRWTFRSMKRHGAR